MCQQGRNILQDTRIPCNLSFPHLDNGIWEDTCRQQQVRGRLHLVSSTLQASWLHLQILPRSNDQVGMVSTRSRHSCQFWMLHEIQQGMGTALDKSRLGSSILASILRPYRPSSQRTRGHLGMAYNQRHFFRKGCHCKCLMGKGRLAVHPRSMHLVGRGFWSSQPCLLDSSSQVDSLCIRRAH